MQGYNHVAGGVVFTGIFASFHDVNVFSSAGLISVTVACALLPDVDHTRSLIGKTCYPVAAWLQRQFGHRTLTHSLCFLLGTVGLLLLAPRSYVIVGGYALLSHLLFDMCTKQGVPLLYPFSKRPFVLPANPGLRLSAQDHRSEAIVFVVFLVLGFFCQPLFANGFWTQYNRAFATWEHVEREAKRSHDLLQVVWTDAQQRQHTGYFLRKDGSAIVVVIPPGFELTTAHETKLVSFAHSGLTATEHQYSLTNVALDSVNRLLTNHCLRVQLQASEDLTYFDGPILKTGKLIDLAYRKHLLVAQAPHDDSETLNRIQLLNIERSAEQLRYAREVQQYQQTQQKTKQLALALQRLIAEYPLASDYRKAQLIALRRETETALKTAEANEPLPPIQPDFRRYDLQEQLLRKQLEHRTTLNANITTLTLNGRHNRLD